MIVTDFCGIVNRYGSLFISAGNEPGSHAIIHNGAQAPAHKALIVYCSMGNMRSMRNMSNMSGAPGHEINDAPRTFL